MVWKHEIPNCFIAVLQCPGTTSRLWFRVQKARIQSAESRHDTQRNTRCPMFVHLSNKAETYAKYIVDIWGKPGHWVFCGRLSNAQKKIAVCQHIFTITCSNNTTFIFHSPWHELEDKWCPTGCRPSPPPPFPHQEPRIFFSSCLGSFTHWLRGPPSRSVFLYRGIALDECSKHSSRVVFVRIIKMQ